MCKIRHLNYSTSSVPSGIKSFAQRRMTAIGGSNIIYSTLFAAFTVHYIKEPILLHQVYHYATSLPIFSTNPLPQYFLVLSNSMMIRWPSFPSPVQTRLPHPYLPHPMSTKTSRLCHRLIAHGTHTLVPIRLLTASKFLLPCEILPMLAQHKTLSPQVSTPLQKPPPLLLVPLPPHRILFFPRVKQTS